MTRTTGITSHLHPVVLLTGALLLTTLLLLWFSAASLGNLHTGDTDQLVHGARTASRCLGDGHLTSCGFEEGTRTTEVGPYPLLQYIPSIVFVWLGFSDSSIVGALGRVNIVAFGAAIVLAAWVFRRRPACAALAIMSLLASSAVYQSTAGFGEMLAAATLVAAVVFAIERRLVLLFVSCALATLGKETMAPFVLMLTLLASRDDDDGWLPKRRPLIAQCAGVALGVALTFGFNIFRFGSLRNRFYLDPLYRTPGLGRKLEFLAGGWLSPSSGIALYWPVATAVLAGCVTLATVRIVRNPRDLRQWLPTAVMAGTAVLFTAGLAAWLSPFGWITYGPRLAVPVLPALTIVALHLNADAVERVLVGGHSRPLLLVAGALVIVIAGWPQFGSAWSHPEAIDQLIAGDDTCPSMIETPIQEDKAEYYRCLSHVMWRTNSVPIDDAAKEGGATAQVARVISAGACVALLLPRTRRAVAP